MSVLAFIIGSTLGSAVVLIGQRCGRARRRRPPAATLAGDERVLLPFGPEGLADHALRTALRSVGGQDGTLVATALIVIPRRLPADATAPRQTERALVTLEAVEAEAARAGVRAESRLARGRSTRHALIQALDEEPVGRVLVAASRTDAPAEPGFAPDDVAWLLTHVRPEVVVVRARLRQVDDGHLDGAERGHSHPRRRKATHSPVAVTTIRANADG